MNKGTEFEILLRLAAAKSIEKDMKFFDELEVPEEPVSDRARRRFYRALRKETLKDSVALTAFKRVAVACMAVITIGFGVCMSIQPVRAAFWNAIVTWYEDYVAVLFEPEEEMPTTIEEQITPVVPDGWICEVIKSNDINYSCILLGPNGEQVIYSQSVYSDEEEWFDDNSIIENIILDNGINAILLTLDDGSISVTFKSKYVFEVLGYDISRDALMRIVNGIN
ncbi:MAG: hypothetical protein E7627_04160 [Ruminococcaceae bacterium]|nr:hypothetical protein [Oscillospiraceae bacterium]